MDVDLECDDADDLVDNVAQPLAVALCRRCIRSFGCLVVVVEFCRCNCLMLTWKM